MKWKQKIFITDNRNFFFFDLCINLKNDYSNSRQPNESFIPIFVSRELIDVMKFS